VGGLLGDRFGVKLVAIAPRIAMTLLLYPAMLLVISSGSPWVFVAVIAVMMAFHGMSSGCGILLIPMIFPPSIRTSGLSISYGLGVTLFGGTALLVFQAIINQTGDKLSWIWYIIVMSLVSLVATFAIREPRE
jgi:nitrate/nitrite transporter NarK